MQHGAAQSYEAEPSDSHSSVHQILQEMMMSSQLNGVGAPGNDMKGMNGITSGLGGANCLVGNGISSSTGISGVGFGGMSGISPSATAGGIRAAMVNSAMAMNGRVGMNHISQDPTVISHQRQQDMSSGLPSGLGAVNNFNNRQFDWKTSP